MHNLSVFPLHSSMILIKVHGIVTYQMNLVQMTKLMIAKGGQDFAGKLTNAHPLLLYLLM